MLELTKCDGIMVGRGTLGNPWILEQIRTYLENGEIRQVSNEEKIKKIGEHYDLDV